MKFNSTYGYNLGAKLHLARHGATTWPRGLPDMGKLGMGRAELAQSWGAFGMAALAKGIKCGRMTAIK